MPRIEKQNQVCADVPVAMRAPPGSMAVHREMGKVEVFAVDGEHREVRIPGGEGYRHAVVHADTLFTQSIDDLFGIRTHEDRILMSLLVGQTFEN